MRERFALIGHLLGAAEERGSEQRERRLVPAEEGSKPDSFVAYDDLAPKVGESHLPNGRCWVNAITTGRRTKPDQRQGELRDHMGRLTGVWMEFEEHKTHKSSTISKADDPGHLHFCSPAFQQFGSCMCEDDSCFGVKGLCETYNSAAPPPPETWRDCKCGAFAGELSYNDEPGWFLRYKLSGLNKACSVNLVLFVDRGEGNRGNVAEDLEDRRNRYTLFTLEDNVGSFTADVDSAFADVDDGRTLVIRGGANVDGHVAKWTGIRHNGNVSILASHDRKHQLVGRVSPPPHPYKAYAGGLMRLEQHCPWDDTMQMVGNGTPWDMAVPPVAVAVLLMVCFGVGYLLKKLPHFHELDFSDDDQELAQTVGRGYTAPTMPGEGASFKEHG